jgi:protein TonB
MFADSLLDSHWANRSHRGWTTLVSFAVQVLAVGVVIVLPLIYTEGLPRLHLISIGAPIGPPRGQPAVATAHAGGGSQSAAHSFIHVFTAPPRIPVGIGREEGPAIEGTSGCPECIVGAPGSTDATNSIIGSIGPAMPIIASPPSKPVAPPRLSRIMEGNLIYKVQPVYPPLARAARIQGSVVLKAIISRTGTIEGLQALSGHPMLIPAARDAVAQWRYRPYLLNSEPVEVETQVTVNFILGGG